MTSGQVNSPGVGDLLGSDQRQVLKELHPYGLCLSLHDLREKAGERLWALVIQKLRSRQVPEARIALVVAALSREVEALAARMRLDLTVLLAQVLGDDLS